MTEKMAEKKEMVKNNINPKEGGAAMDKKDVNNVIVEETDPEIKRKFAEMKAKQAKREAANIEAVAKKVATKKEVTKKKSATATKPKTREVKMDDPRSAVEAFAVALAKKEKMTITRVNPKVGSSKPGPVRIMKDGEVKVAVRADDIIFYTPLESMKQKGMSGTFIKTGRAVAGYPHITKMIYSDNLDTIKANMETAIKDRRTSSEWARLYGWAGRKPASKATLNKQPAESLKARLERLEMERKAIEAELKNRKPKAVRKPKIVKPTTENA